MVHDSKAQKMELLIWCPGPLAVNQAPTIAWKPPWPPVLSLFFLSF